jgi:divalent metal cation (Fe/Co/Zn/Cd) transporter
VGRAAHHRYTPGMRELLASASVAAALIALGALIAHFAVPSLIAERDLDMLYALGAAAVAVPVLTVLVARDIRKQR